jgi:hypothetical protein
LLLLSRLRLLLSQPRALPLRPPLRPPLRILGLQAPPLPPLRRPWLLLAQLLQQGGEVCGVWGPEELQGDATI